MSGLTLLKVIQGESAKEIEGATNTWIKDSGKVHSVVNMRVYPPSDKETLSGRPLGVEQWTNYIVYKEKYEYDDRPRSSEDMLLPPRQVANPTPLRGES